MELRVRKDSSTYDIPNWSEGQIGDSILTVFSKEMELRPIQPEDFIERIEHDVKLTGDFERGWLQMNELMTSFPETTAYRPYLDKYIANIKDPDFIVRHVTDIKSDIEYMSLLKANIHLKDKERISHLVKDARYDSIKGGMMNYLKEEIEKLI